MESGDRGDSVIRRRREESAGRRRRARAFAASLVHLRPALAGAQGRSTNRCAENGRAVFVGGDAPPPRVPRCVSRLSRQTACGSPRTQLQRPSI
ncbi:hypothetical protein AQ908_11920 [Burkholderia pseudomallei]|nr:hypothetical protein BURPS668_A1285 [Burkholderia pseudomallei 668]ONA02060.1 hypothetical protein AQ874_27605 [Burkholderia pseudomallei]ONC00847.1 hypothetical protein AQ908_11920 [Burkholderia pseudomallei]